MLAHRQRLLAAPRATQGDGSPGEQPSVSDFAEQLMRDPENAARMAKVTEAAQRVAELQAESERLAAAMAEAAAEESAGAEARERSAARAAAEIMAEAEAKAAEKLLRAAQLQAEAADVARQKWAADINEDAEKLESAKAAAAAGAGGAVATLPLVLSGAGGVGLGALLALATAGLTSALLGVTYRYAVRQDTANLQLKSGVVAAFGLARGLGEASGLLSAAGGGLDLSPDALGGAALAVGQCMLAAAFAATAVEAGFQQGLVKPFGTAGGSSEADSS